MLTAYDFRYMYEHGTLPQIKINTSFMFTDDNIKISQEWKRIEEKLDYIAKSFLNSQFPETYPPCFYIPIKYTENVIRVRTELSFKIKSNNLFKFDTCLYCLEF